MCTKYHFQEAIDEVQCNPRPAERNYCFVNSFAVRTNRHTIVATDTVKRWHITATQNVSNYALLCR